MSCIISYPDLTLFYTEKSRGRSGYEIMSCIIQGGGGGGGGITQRRGPNL